MRKKLDCWLESDDGLTKADLVVENGKYYGMWVDGYIQDGFDPDDEVADMTNHYGNKFYLSKADYKKDISHSITEWITQAEKETDEKAP